MTAKVSAAEQELLDLDDLMLRPEFRRFTLRVLELTGMFQTTHVANAQTQSAFAEGKRAAGLMILDMLTARQPDALLRVLSEQQPFQPTEQTNGRRSRYPTDRDDD